MNNGKDASLSAGHASITSTACGFSSSYKFWLMKMKLNLPYIFSTSQELKERNSQASLVLTRTPEAIYNKGGHKLSSFISWNSTSWLRVTISKPGLHAIQGFGEDDGLATTAVPWIPFQTDQAKVRQRREHFRVNPC